MKKEVLVFFCLLFASISFAGSFEDINWITEDYPPYNYKEGEVKKGIAVDLLFEIFKKIGLNKGPDAIQIMPWNRGVQLVSTHADTCLFAATLTAERREKLGWKFALPIPLITVFGSGNHLIAKKISKIVFTSRQDIAKYDKRIGVVRNDVGEGLLTGSNFPQDYIDYASNPTSLVKKLLRGRVDVISYGCGTAFAKMKESGIDPNDYEVVFTFPPTQMGYAFHKDTDPALLAKFQTALDELTADGTAKTIRAKYIKK